MKPISAETSASILLGVDNVRLELNWHWTTFWEDLKSCRKLWKKFRKTFKELQRESQRKLRRELAVRTLNLSSWTVCESSSVKRIEPKWAFERFGSDWDAFKSRFDCECWVAAKLLYFSMHGWRFTGEDYTRLSAMSEPASTSDRAGAESSQLGELSEQLGEQSTEWIVTTEQSLIEQLSNVLDSLLLVLLIAT